MQQNLLFIFATTLIASASASWESHKHNFLWPAREARNILGSRSQEVDNFGISQMHARQVPTTPPTTNTAQCDEFDGYFYVTPRNYTWQLQCSTNYEGSTLSQIDVANFSSCIGACIDYNRANGAGACVAVTFNGPSDGATGLCTRYSLVVGVLLAYEEGNVQDSALLVFGPDGTQYATPQPSPGFSGAPTQPPSVVPVPIPDPRTSTVFSTSIVYVTSCPPGVQNCPTGTAKPTTGTSTNSYPVVSSIANGGPRPSPSITSTPPVSAPSSESPGQRTFTTIVPFTEYQVQIVEICSATPTTCMDSTVTSTKVGYRTAISCSPGVCTGWVIMTQAVADFTATGICVAGQ